MLGRYRSHLIERGLSDASINLHLAALRKLSSEVAAHGGLCPLAAAEVCGVLGVRTCNSLTLQQAQRLLAEADPETIKGLSDWVLLRLLVGCGLQRRELAGLGRITPHDLRRNFAKLAHLSRTPSSRSRSRSAMPRSRLPSATWDCGITSTTPPAIGWGWWYGRG